MKGGNGTRKFRLGEPGGTMAGCCRGFKTLAEEQVVGHVRLDELQKAAQRERYAIPHFLGATVEMVTGQIRAAEDRQSPLAFGFAPEVFPMIPLEVGLTLMVRAAEKARVPVATQLEHGRDFETIMKAIGFGVRSVMFDGSGLPYEENVERTKEIVKVAHSLEVAVEAELGSVGGSAVKDLEEKESYLTDPDLVVDFVRRTEVDTLAISFGNVHGKYRGVPNLDYSRVREIRSRIDTPLVMHGGSGLSETEYRGAIESGISNIHFYTGIAIGVWKRMCRLFGDDGEVPVYHELVACTTDHFYEAAINVIDMLGSAGKALFF